MCVRAHKQDIGNERAQTAVNNLCFFSIKQIYSIIKYYSIRQFGLRKREQQQQQHTQDKTFEITRQ